MSTIGVSGSFFWYQLILVDPDKIQRAVKRLCVRVRTCTRVCVCVILCVNIDEQRAGVVMLNDGSHTYVAVQL